MAKKPGITIESGIPIPAIGYSGKWKSILLKMKVGDSFVVPDETVGSVRGSVAHLNKKLKSHEWVVKKADHASYRCWRIK